MDVGKVVKTGIAVGITAIVLDFVVNNVVLGSYIAGLPFVNTTYAVAMTWNLVGDLVAGLVFALVFARVRGSFGPGIAGGLTFGLYAGVIINFPTWHFAHLYIKDWPYSASWVWMCSGIVIALVEGAVAGIVYDMGEKKAAA
jgi:hypothetical protein